MTDRAKLYSALPYAVEVLPDVTTEGEACFLARHPELPGCMSHGATPEDALANLSEARELYIASMLDDGIEPPVPTPRTPMSAIWRVATSHHVGARPLQRTELPGGITPLAALSK